MISPYSDAEVTTTGCPMIMGRKPLETQRCRAQPHLTRAAYFKHFRFRIRKINDFGPPCQLQPHADVLAPLAAVAAPARPASKP